MNHPSFVRSSGLWLILGVILGTPVGLSPLVFLFPDPSPAFTVRQVLIDLFHLIVLFAIIGLARSGTAGNGWLAKSGLSLALTGGTLFIAAELILVFAETMGGILDGISSILLGMGLVFAGIAVLRTQHWHGWHRFTPLLAGLYVFFPLLPVLVITNASGVGLYLALNGWSIPFLLLGVALYAAGSEQQSSQVVAA